MLDVVGYGDDLHAICYIGNVEQLFNSAHITNN